MDDLQLLELLDTNPADGMELLESMYGEPVRLAAAQRLNCAEDVRACVQDTFTDFYLQRKRFDPSKGTLRGYLVTISTRKAIRRWRDNQRQWLAAQQEVSIDDEIDVWMRREQVDQILSQLPELDQRILRLKYFEQYTIKEIAAKLDVDYERVKKRLQRALKKLPKTLE